MPAIRTGGCLCGAVRYRYRGPLRPVVACHCEQCRRTSGHYAAGTAGWRERLEIDEGGGLRWFESSPGVERGFCSECGASLFWMGRPGQVTIMAGTLDAPTGLRLTHQIHTAHAGDYYDLDPALAGAPGAGVELPAIPADDGGDRDGED